MIHEQVKEDNMCLSNVYLNEKEEKMLFIKEAMKIITNSQGVQIHTLLDEDKYLQDYYISKVDLMEHYVILKKRTGANAST